MVFGHSAWSAGEWNKIMKLYLVAAGPDLLGSALVVLR
jgi:hypothetical protein